MSKKDCKRDIFAAKKSYFCLTRNFINFFAYCHVKYFFFLIMNNWSTYITIKKLYLPFRWDIFCKVISWMTFYFWIFWNFKNHFTLKATIHAMKANLNFKFFGPVKAKKMAITITKTKIVKNNWSFRNILSLCFTTIL